MWSGATMPGGGDLPDHVEGVPGRGDDFMLGSQIPGQVPPVVDEDVRLLLQQLNKVLGPVRIEWAHDGRRAWLLQLHVATHFYSGSDTLSPGEADTWLDFDVADGLEGLRDLIPRAVVSRSGVRVHGDLGITSHVGDLLRKAGVPAVLARPALDTRHT